MKLLVYKSVDMESFNRLRVCVDVFQVVSHLDLLMAIRKKVYTYIHVNMCISFSSK